MPLQGLTGGDIPWLINEPPSAALARGASVGQGIASSRLAAGQQRMQADQLRVVAQRVASSELSRQLGMKAAAMEIQAFQEANPNATEAQLSAVRKRALFNQAPKIFSDSPENLFQAINTDEANAIRLEAARNLDEHRRRADITDAENKALIGELRIGKIISDAQAKEMDRNVEKVRADNQSAHWKAMEKIAQDKLEFDKNKPAGESVGEQQIESQLNDESAIAASNGNPWTQQKRLERRVELRTLKNFKPGLKGRMEMNPDGTMSMQFGDDTTVGTQTKIQSELAGLQNSVTQINNATKTLREKDVGVAGSVWDSIMNKWVSQVAPDAGDPSVASNRVKVQQAVESYLESQQARGRLSKAERENMRKALVGLGPGESLPRSQEVLKTMAKLQQIQAISLAKSAQQQLKDWMFIGLGDQDFKTLVSSGDITEDEAVEWYLKSIR